MRTQLVRNFGLLIEKEPTMEWRHEKLFAIASETIAGQDLPVLGAENHRLYVNSSDSISREKVGEKFGNVPEALTRGAIPYALVVRELGDDVLVGDVQIRDLTQRIYSLATGQDMITDTRARQLLADLPMAVWHDVHYVRLGALNEHLARKIEERREGIAIRTRTNSGPL